MNASFKETPRGPACFERGKPEGSWAACGHPGHPHCLSMFNLGTDLMIAGIVEQKLREHGGQLVLIKGGA